MGVAAPSFASCVDGWLRFVVDARRRTWKSRNGVGNSRGGGTLRPRHFPRQHPRACFRGKHKFTRYEMLKKKYLVRYVLSMKASTQACENLLAKTMVTACDEHDCCDFGSGTTFPLPSSHINRCLAHSLRISASSPPLLNPSLGAPAFRPKVAERLVNGPGRGWASRVFYTDNGSTATEVAIKMGFRQGYYQYQTTNTHLIPRSQTPSRHVDLKLKRSLPSTAVHSQTGCGGMIPLPLSSYSLYSAAVSIYVVRPAQPFRRDCVCPSLPPFLQVSCSWFPFVPFTVFFVLLPRSGRSERGMGGREGS